jgi:hypothetical protein
VAQTIYTHVSKCKNDQTKEEKEFKIEYKMTVKRLHRNMTTRHTSLNSFGKSSFSRMGTEPQVLLPVIK